MREKLTFSIATICVLLLALPAAAQVLAIPAGPDLWETTDDGTTSVQLTSTNLDELCNFTGAPHSDDTTVSVALKGVPIDPTSLGTTSTVVTRLADANFSAYGETVTVPIQVTDLQFESISPVQTNCGPLDLSVSPAGPQPVSTADITLIDPSGGVFSAIVQVDLVAQASGAQNGVTRLSGTLNDTGSEPWSVNPPKNAVNPGIFNPGVVNGGRVVICRRKGQVLPSWHCYQLAQALVAVEPVDPVGVN